MNELRITIAAFDCGTSARSLRERLLATWSDGAPEIDVVDPAALDQAALEGVDAVVVMTSAPSEAESLSFVSRLEELRLAVLVVSDEALQPGNCYEYAGAVVQRSASGDPLLAGVLHGLAHRQRTVRELQQEAALSERFRGGLSGQVNKMHDELQLAAVVQREFLPRGLQPLHGVECAALWRPAHYVSGDLYDVIRLDEHHLGLFVADCIGHGVPAALMTMVVHRSLRVKEIRGSDYRLLAPDEVLARLNADLIRRQGTSTRFVTAAYAMLDCRTRRLSIATGGHPPPIVLERDGSTRLIETSGGLIGVFHDEQYEKQDIELGLDDRLLLYSDGFEQAFPDPDADCDARRMPTTRYLDEFDRLRDSDSATGMIEEIARRLNDQRGSLHQADDLTLLCTHAGPVPAETVVPSRASNPVAV